MIDSLSGDETMHSAQGYETAVIADNSDTDTSEDAEYFEENIYR